MSKKRTLLKQRNRPLFPYPPTPASPVPPLQATHGNHPISSCFRGRLHSTSRKPDDKRPRGAAPAAVCNMMEKTDGTEPVGGDLS